jgi:PiT family inorganic phosphate transporter
MNIWVILIIGLSFLVAFSIGANDAANGLGTSYGSKAIKLVPLLILGALAEFVGAMFLSANVASKLVESTIPPIKNGEIGYEEVNRMMMAVCLASFIFIICSSTF